MTVYRRPTTQALQLLTSMSLIWFALIALFSNLRYALASDVSVDSIVKDDHNHHRLESYPDILPLSDHRYSDLADGAEQEQAFVQYEAEFLGEDRGILGERELAVDHAPLTNNGALQVNPLSSQSILYYQMEAATIYGSKTPPGVGLPSAPFPKVEISGPNDNPTDDDLNDFFKRQTSDGEVTVYITINTCGQPRANKTIPSPFPQLTLYVSTATSTPGPDARSEDQTVLPLVEGFASMNISAKSDVYVAVQSPDIGSYTGGWSYELAGSIDAPYHNWNNWEPPNAVDPWNPLLFVDSDSTSSLLITQNFTSLSTSDDINEKWEESPNPFTLFAFRNGSAIDGMSHSFCGINKAAEQLGKAPGNTTTSVITRGNGGLPKGQFYITSLSGGSNYTVLMAMQGNSTMGGSGVVGGGGQVWRALTFPTKANNNCALVFDLPFCSQNAWSVPYNPKTVENQSQLVSMYDNFTRFYYDQFNMSMQQIACDTADTARYSLATGCQNCSDAYKDWLCAVSMPRCRDFGTVDASAVGVVDSVGFPRNLAQPFPNGTSVTDASLATDLTAAGLNTSWLDRIYSNQSRFPGLIDQEIQPGPYLELLPCEDLCYSLIRNCPAAMGFACPIEPGLSRSYAKVGKCNSPGNVFFPGAGSDLAPHLGLLLGLLGVCMILGIM